jgi:hypothetical protein
VPQSQGNANQNQKANKANANQPNTFTSKDAADVVKRLVYVATDQQLNGSKVGDRKRPVLVRVGAIDSLGQIGGDQTVSKDIVDGLRQVLTMEFDDDKGFLDPSGTGSSEFVCLHVVQAVGNLGWSARAALPQIQIMRGRNPILDTAITDAVTAMQTSQPPPQSQGQAANTPATPAPSNPSPAAAGDKTSN